MGRPHTALGIPATWLLVAAGALLCAASAGASTTYYVGSLADDGATASDCTTSTNSDCELRYAMQLAIADGQPDTIQFVSTLAGTITLTSGAGGGLPSITGNLTITGPGAGTIAIDGGRAFTVFTIGSGAVAVISGVTIRNGEASQTPAVQNDFTASGIDGGAVWNSGTLTLNTMVLTANTAPAGAGGAIYNSSTGVLALENSTISANTSGQDGGTRGYGGGLLNYGSATVTTSTFSGNIAAGGGQGGAIYNLGSLTLTDSTIAQNQSTDASSAGGGAGSIYSIGPTTILNSTIDGNTVTGASSAAAGTGGGLLQSPDSASSPTVSSTGVLSAIPAVSISSIGTAGLTTPGGTLTTDACEAPVYTIDGSDNVGGYSAPLNTGTCHLGAPTWLPVIPDTLPACAASCSYFPGITLDSTTPFQYQVLQANVPENQTSYIYFNLPNTTDTLVPLAMGLSSSGSFYIPQTGQPATLNADGTIGNAATFLQDFSTTALASAGDSWYSGPLATLSTNSGVSNKGYYFKFVPGTNQYGANYAQLVLAYIDTNSGCSTGTSRSDCTLPIILIDVNVIPSASSSIANTIVARNTAASDPDAAGVFTDSGGNLIGATDGTSGFTTSTLLGAAASPLNPLLASLGNYGGQTETMIPLPGSPAIGGGNTGALGSLTVDQRGLPRTLSGQVDVGSDESQGFTLAVVSGTPQSAQDNQAFAAPLIVQVTANNAGEPIAGGTVSFSAPGSGASATLGAGAVTTGSDGKASDTATANGIPGNYNVTASLASQSVQFALTNYSLTPVLGLTKAANGSFVAGLTAEWDIAVTNLATGTTTSGPISVSDLLPGGESLASYTSDGSAFTCVGTTSVTCTTSSAITGGNSIGIQLIVNVPSQGSVTNVAIAWGGGDTTHFNADHPVSASASALASQTFAGFTFSYPSSFENAPNAFAGWPVYVTVTAVDQVGTPITSYADTVHVTSTDPSAVLPPDSTLSSGSGTFQATLNTVGTQTFTVTDTSNAIGSTSGGIVVAAPPILVVTSSADGAADSTQCTPQTTPGSGTDAACTLRDALAYALNNLAGSITFDSTKVPSGTTIDVDPAQAAMDIPNDTSITASYTGAGTTLSDGITVSGNNATNVFTMGDQNAQGRIDGIAITGGYVSDSTAGTFVSGSGIASDGTLTVKHSVISNNSTSAPSGEVDGGGIYTDNDLEISDSVITANTGTGLTVIGGGIDNDLGGYLDATNVIVSNNTASATVSTGFAGGGGVATDCADFTASTISGNSALGAADGTGVASGGGIATLGCFTMIDSTVSGNSSTAAGKGGGGGLLNEGLEFISSSTISGNTSEDGGGIYNDGFDLELWNTIVSGNTAPIGSDFDFDTSDLVDNGGNLVGATGINLAPLGDYGGPTQTMIPLPGSPAICNGVLANIYPGVTTDQRGFPNTNTIYPGYTSGTACVDSGSVQTAYALAFTTQPPSHATTGVAMAPAPVVGLTENSQAATAPTNTIAMTDTGSALSAGGTNQAALSGGSATFSNLILGSALSNDTLTATLALTSTVNLTATSSTEVTSNGTPVITWAAPADIPYGTALGPAQLDAAANVLGSFSYTPAAGTVLDAGNNQTLSVTFTPLDTTDYTTATFNVDISVLAVTPAITWNPASTIIFGSAGSNVLNASVGCTSCGSFSYTESSGGTPAAITTTAGLAAGTYTIAANFTSTSGNYNSTSTSQQLTVSGESVWVVNNGGGTAELAGNGYAITSSADAGGNLAAAIDATGNVWTLGTGSTLLESVSQTGIAQHSVSSGGGLDAPSAIAVDGNSDLWIANSGNNTVSLFLNDGSASSPSTGFTDSSLDNPSGIAVDLGGSVWIANKGNNSLTRILGAAAPAASPSTAAKNNSTGAKP